MKLRFKFKRYKKAEMRRMVALGQASCLIVDAIAVLNELDDPELEDERKALCDLLHKASEKDKYLTKRDFGIEEE